MSQKKRKPNQAKLAKASKAPKRRAPLGEHLQELKRRLIYVAVSVAVGSALAYAVETKLIAILLRPSHGQHFVYTSPMGGVNFLFSVCIFVGIALSLPIIVFNLLKFLLPLMRDTTTRFIYTCSIVSGLVAVCGILFGYYAGLPAALHFLLHQFHSDQVSALISIQSYFSFVTAYMVGAAIMFQLPLILVIINRIKPLKPSQMFKAERPVILFAFVAAFIMNPTPNVIDQMLVVIPIIIMYQMGIGLVWLINRRNGRIKYSQLFEQDVKIQAERLRQASEARPLVEQSVNAPLLAQFEMPVANPVLDLTPVPVSVTEEQPDPVEAYNETTSENTVVAPVASRQAYTTASPAQLRANYQMSSSRLIQ